MDFGRVAAVVLLFAAPAHAEDAPKPPDFVPVVVDQAQFTSAMQYLGGLKYSDAAPLVQWLTEQEQRAKAQWLADHTPKGEPAKQ